MPDKQKITTNTASCDRAGKMIKSREKYQQLHDCFSVTKQ